MKLSISHLFYQQNKKILEFTTTQLDSYTPIKWKKLHQDNKITKVANQQFRKVKLINTQDTAYLNFCSECALRRQTLKPKLSPTAINKLSLVFEDVMRNLLAKYFILTANRILSFEERRNQSGYIQKYREIDAVGVERSQPNLLFEIKTSSKPNPEKVIGKARKQLRKSKEVASLLNSNLKLCVIYIDIYSQKTITPSALSSFNVSLGKTFNALQADMLEEIPCIVLSGAEIWYQAVSRGLIENSFLWTEAQTEIEENIYKQDRRNALIAEGITAEEFPDNLQLRSTKQTTPQILQFGEFNEETSFRKAFLKAQQKQKSQHLVAQ